MSTLLMGPIVNTPISARFNDERILREDYRRITLDQRDINVSGVNYLWPRSSFTGYLAGTSYTVWECRHQDWEANTHYYAASSTHVPRKITGQTLYANGSIQSGVTVQLFNTANGALVDTQISDAGGNYTLNDPNATSCFVVGYDALNPDVAGTTKNNLTGV